jgi:hypothetical protein
MQNRGKFVRGLYDKNINNFLRPYEEKNCRATAPVSRGIFVRFQKNPPKRGSRCTTRDGVFLEGGWCKNPLN